MLSNKSKSVLKKISEFDAISLKDLVTHFPEFDSKMLQDIIKELGSLGYIESSNVIAKWFSDRRIETLYRTTTNGHAQLERIESMTKSNKNNEFHKWVNVVIGALTALATITALIVSIVQQS